jgi:hypothetical protein
MRNLAPTPFVVVIDQISEAEQFYDLGEICGRAYRGDPLCRDYMNQFSPNMCEIAMWWRHHANRGLVLTGLLEDWGGEQIKSIYEDHHCGR